VEESLVYLTSLLFGLGGSEKNVLHQENVEGYCVFFNLVEGPEEAEQAGTRRLEKIADVAWAVVTPHKLGLDTGSVLYQHPVMVLVEIGGGLVKNQLPAFADCLGVQWHDSDNDESAYICFEGCQRLLNAGGKWGKQTALYLAQKMVGPAEGLLWDYLKSGGEV
jgi:hypothetical protein